MTKEIEDSIRQILQQSERLTEANTCRTTVPILADHVRENFPGAVVKYLVYPEAREGSGVHYALLIQYAGQKILVNAVKAGIFPRYIGNYDQAIPTFTLMKVTPEVI